jgi:hypothetical protein
MRYCGEVRKWVLPWIKPRGGGSVEGTLARGIPSGWEEGEKAKGQSCLGIGRDRLRKHALTKPTSDIHRLVSMLQVPGSVLPDGAMIPR